MIAKAAKTSLSIRILTSIVLASAAGCLIGGAFEGNLLIVGIFLGLVAFLCYLFAPVAYEVSDGRLTVVFHAGRKCFGPVVSCSRIAERLPFTIRLFGNGGLFAGSGIFWNRRYGIFRAYVTSARPQDAVLVQTANHKVVITPEDPQAFVENIKTLNP